MRKIMIGLLAWGYLLPSQAAISDEQSAAVFTPAKPLQAEQPSYPESMRLSQNTGMVDLRLVIDAQGQVQHAMVLSSSMDEFEGYALDAASRFQYAPAKLGEQGVESVVARNVLYSAKDAQQKMHVDFAKLYRDATRELDRKTPKQSKLASKIDKLERFNKRSPYISTHLNLLKFRAAKRFSDVPAQIAAIEKILLFADISGEAGPYVDGPTKVAVMRELFAAYTNFKRYAEALAIFQKLKALDPQAEDMFGATAKQLYALKYAKNPVSLELMIAPRGYVSLDLFKRTFELKSFSKPLSSMKFLCAKKFVTLNAKIGEEYDVPKSWGQCYLQLIGEPGTSINITQR